MCGVKDNATWMGRHVGPNAIVWKRGDGKSVCAAWIGEGSSLLLAGLAVVLCVGL